MTDVIVVTNRRCTVISYLLLFAVLAGYCKGQSAAARQRIATALQTRFPGNDSAQPQYGWNKVPWARDPKDKFCGTMRPDVRKKSHWCKLGPIGGNYKQSKPGKTQLGRQTMYTGPILSHVGHCGLVLRGWQQAAGVALSTKYMYGKFPDGKSPRDSMCGKCLCVKTLGHDPTFAKKPDQILAGKQWAGKIFKAVAIDQCSECSDEHIDVLMDMPYAYATPSRDNTFAAIANARPGKRVFPDGTTPFRVGAWVVEWGFASCNADCQTFFK